MLTILSARRVRVAPGLHRAARALAGATRRLLAWSALCRQRAQQRRALRELDAAQRRDIGITEGEALREAAKPFWRP
jgi:uncharacterized protein YjiS (DUF1127 family)